MDPLRNYLAWQAEMGQDEVILTAPLPARNPVTGVGGLPAGGPANPGLSPRAHRPAPTEAPLAPGRPAEPAPASSEGTGADASKTPPEGLFHMLVKSLEESADTARAARAVESGIAGRLAAKAPENPASSLPAFASLADFRTWVEANLRTLISGEAAADAARLVPGAGPEGAPLALVAMEPSAADAAAASPFQGEAGELLAKMMRAIKLDFGSLYLTCVVKFGGGRRSWTRRDLVRLLPLLHAELGLARPPVVLLLGEACAQAVLKTGKGLEELRGAVHRLEGAPDRLFAATYHPEDLLRNEALKHKAWEDLKWLRQNLLAS